MSMSSSQVQQSQVQSQVQQSQVQQSQEEQSQVQHSSQEIKQDNLKTQLVSAITDLEGDTEMVDFGKENKTIDLMSPPQAKSPTPKAAAFTPTKQDPFSPAKQPQDVFSPPPLERFEPPAQPQPTAQPQANGALHAEPAPAPVRNGLSSNGLQNGFTEFVSTKNIEMEQIQ